MKSCDTCHHWRYYLQTEGESELGPQAGQCTFNPIWVAVKRGDRHWCGHHEFDAAVVPRTGQE